MTKSVLNFVLNFVNFGCK